MSSRSESSAGKSGLQSGVPTKCHYGSSVRKYISQTADKPGRPFFRCETMSKKDHVFKWVEDALIEEVEEIKGRDETRDDAINKLRSDFDSMIEEIYDIHQHILEGNKENKKFKIGVAIGFSVVFMAIAFLKIW